MIISRILTGLLLATGLFLTACTTKEEEGAVELDILLIGGDVYLGNLSPPQKLDIGLKGEQIAFIGQSSKQTVDAKKTLNVEGLAVMPGFIDPHTHALNDLLDSERAINLNYLTQGVTTVLTGNDGGGPTNTAEVLAEFEAAGIGTNAGLFVGHGTIRKEVMGLAERAPDTEELSEMKALLKRAMHEGAFGFSAGLYYAPGSYAETSEIIELAKILNETGGIYESHIRDESSYSIGLIAAIEEVIEIGKEAGIPVHIAHIKALGTDVWGQSADVISIIEKARMEGLRVTADQYPWLASGTRISNALIPNWVKADSKEAMFERLQDLEIAIKIDAEIKENLRKRGGASAILITDARRSYAGQTLENVAQMWELDAINTAKKIVLEGDARIASFNMKGEDVEAFMRRPWVMTSSDGTNGHPRKYASFPEKFEIYVKDKALISVEEFIYRSSGLTAETFGLCQRGFIRDGYVADIAVLDLASFSSKADYANPTALSQGVIHLFVNGKAAILDGVANTRDRHGHSLKMQTCAS